ncbi:MAG: hypothetical protein K2L67_03935 [Clostridia bacterium]|nr:hypothetical protein [Clostridia bacterium]
MKKTIKAMLLGILATLTVAACVVFAACGGNKDVKFTGEGSFMSLNMDYTLTMKEEDKTFEFVATSKTEIEENGPISQILKGLGRTGTYTFENDVYTLTFSKAVKDANNEDTTTVSSTLADGKYAIAFGIKGGEGTLKIVVTRNK